MTTRTPSPRFFRALALEPRILLDAAAVATAAEVAAQVDAPAPDQAPGVQANAVHGVITLDEGTSRFPAVNLFDAVRVTFGDNQPAPVELVIDVNSQGDNQALLIDGQQIALTAGSGSTDNHRYQVSLSGTTTTLTLQLAPEAASAADLEVLIDSIAYRPLDATLASSSVEVTLNSLRDGTGGVTDLSAIGAAVEVVNHNAAGAAANPDAPLSARQWSGDQADGAPLAFNLQATPSGPELGADIGELDLSDLVTSDEFPNPYQGIRGVASVGDHLYAIRTTIERTYDSNTDTEIEREVSHLYVFQRNQDGTLALHETLVADTQNGLVGAWDISASADGQTLLVSNSDGVALLHRDATTGSLSALGSLQGVGLVTDAVSRGEHLYLSAGEALKVYVRQGNAFMEQDSETAQAAFAQLTALQVSSDGQFLFAGVSGGSSLASVYRIGADGNLTHVADAGTPGGEHFVSALALSADGKALYALDNGNALHRLAIAGDGRLSVSGNAVEVSAGAKQIFVAQDDAALVLVGVNRLELLTRDAAGTLAVSQSYQDIGGTTFSDLRGAGLASDGRQFYLSGEFMLTESFSWHEGLLVLDLQAASSTFREGGTAVAVLPGGTLADTHLDTLNDGRGDYNGSRIVIERENGAQAEDRFGFIDDANLSLAGDKLLLDGVAIADFTQADGKLTLAFIASISQADAQKVLRAIAYSNTSNDPAARANLAVTFHNADGQSTSRVVDVKLTGVNDPAIVAISVLNPTFNAEGEPVQLFENTHIDTVEANQTIARITITVTGVVTGDRLGVDGGRLDLWQRVDWHAVVGNSSIEYRVNVNASAGTTTVTLYLNGPADRAAGLIDSLTFDHTGNHVSGQRTISLDLLETVTDFRESIPIRVVETAVVTLDAALSANTAPSLEGVSPTAAYTEQGDPVALAPDATLADTGLDALNGGQGNYNGATLVVTLGVGRSNADSLGVVPGNGLSLVGNTLQKDGQTIGRVSITDGVMSIVFSDATGTIPTRLDVQNTLRQLSYANSSDVPPASLEARIKLADQHGLESVERSVTLVITPVNDAPVIEDDPILSLGELNELQNLNEIPGLSAPTTSTLSADGSRVYVADGQGNIALFTRDTRTGELNHVQTFAGQTGIIQLQLTTDGSMLYALRENGSSSVITWSAVDADGRLQQQGSLSGLWNIGGLALSDDGRNLYLANQTTIGTYSRDTISGALTHLGDLDASMNSAPYLWSPTEIVSKGNLVFVVTSPSNGSTLIVYERGSDGNLTARANIHSGNPDTTGNPVTLNHLRHIAVSADGRTVFVANSRTTSTTGGWEGPPQTIVNNHAQQVDAFGFDPATGALIHLGTISDTPTVEDMALSPDGKALFVTRNDGSLAYYSAITLERLPSSQTGLTGLTGAVGLSVSADGAVIVSGSSLLVFNKPAITGPRGEIDGPPAILFPAIALNDAELDAADDYQGARVTISGQAGSLFGFLGNATYTVAGERILRGGAEVATLVQAGNSAVLSFTSAISGSDANALLRQITYANTTAAPGSHAIELVLNDGQADSPARTLEFTVLPANQPPVWAGPAGYAPVTAEAGKAYSVILPGDLFHDAEGDALAWSVQGLPAGLTFDALTRSISGSAPIALGTYGFTLSVTDERGRTAERELTLAVVNAAPQIGVAHSLASAQRGQAYSAALPHDLFTDANDSELSWTVELPEWLTYDAQTRTLSGTAPDATATYRITLTAADAHGATVSRTLDLAVTQTASQAPSVLPTLHSAPRPPDAGVSATALGGGALNLAPFDSVDPLGNAQVPAPQPPSASTQGLLRSAGSGLADGRGSLSQQLANADTVLTDTGRQGREGGFSFDGSRLSTTLDLTQGTARSITLELPGELPDGSAPQRVTLANGMPLPSWASFDARTGELRIDRERLSRDGVLRLTLISRDGEGNEQRTPVEIRAEAAAPPGSGDAPPQPAPAPHSLPERMRQDTSGGLLSEARHLLDQLSDLAGEPVAATLRHTV